MYRRHLHGPQSVINRDDLSNDIRKTKQHEILLDFSFQVTRISVIFNLFKIIKLHKNRDIILFFPKKK